MESGFLKTDTNELIYKTETDLKISETKVGLLTGRQGKDKSGAWDGHTPTALYKTGRPARTCCERRELDSVFCDNLCEKGI